MNVAGDILKIQLELELVLALQRSAHEASCIQGAALKYGQTNFFLFEEIKQHKLQMKLNFFNIRM